MSSPPRTATVPAAVARDVTRFAHALVAAVRAQQLYSAQHPATTAALSRLRTSISALLPHAGLIVGVTPATLLVNGEPLAADPRIHEVAALLHDREILLVRIREEPSVVALSDLLQYLTVDRGTVRDNGGPVKYWVKFGHRWLEVGQIDFDRLMADRDVALSGGTETSSASGARSGESDDDVDPQAQDAIWESLVRSASSGRQLDDRVIRRRLLRIAGSADAIHALTTATLHAQKDLPQGAIVATHAAAVLSTFDRLVATVEAQAPDQLPEAIRNAASAAARLDPELVMRAVGESAESGLGAGVTGALGAWFDDDQIARMLAQSMAKEGRAPGRLAAALNTLAPDPERQQRVLRLARDMAPEGNTRETSAFSAAWQFLDQLTSGPGDSAFTSADYAASLDVAPVRSHHLALQTPPQLERWIRTVSLESVRTLSVTLLIDLFTVEQHDEGLSTTADDLAALADDLLLSAELGDAERIARALRTNCTEGSPRRAPAESALHAIAHGSALRDAAATLADLDLAKLAAFPSLCTQLGASALDPLVNVLANAKDGPGRERLETVVATFGPDAVAYVMPLLDHADWGYGRTAIHLLGRIGGADAIAALQARAVVANVKIAREAIAVLVRMDDLAATQAIASLMREKAVHVRQLTMEALLASRRRSTAPLLTDALKACDLLGRDHRISLHLLTALRQVGDDTSVPAIATAMRSRNWLRPTRTLRLKRTAVGALMAIASETSVAALDVAATDGDFLLRRSVRRARRGAA